MSIAWSFFNVLCSRFAGYNFFSLQNNTKINFLLLDLNPQIYLSDVRCRGSTKYKQHTVGQF